MPQPPMLKIAEIFASIQGEGLRQGEPTIFIRFSGCNLHCSFCDTKYAWHEGREFSAPQILNKIKKIRSRFPAPWICLTGGEPLLQDMENLVRLLKKEKLKIQVETNATIYRPIEVDWYSVSPKSDKYFFCPEYREKAKEVKLVATRFLTFEVIKKIRKEFPPQTPLLLQPQSNKKWSMALSSSLLTKAVRAGLDNIRLTYQLHKFYDRR